MRKLSLYLNCLELKKEKWLPATFRCFRLVWIRSRSTTSVSKSLGWVKLSYMAAHFNFSMWTQALTFKSQRSRLTSGRTVSNLNSQWIQLPAESYLISCLATSTDRRVIVWSTVITSCSSTQTNMVTSTIPVKSPSQSMTTQLFRQLTDLTARIAGSKVLYLNLNFIVSAIFERYEVNIGSEAKKWQIFPYRQY